MQQPDFIYTSRTIGLSPSQDLSGGVVVELRPQIQITHRAKGNKMILIFAKDDMKYIIPDKRRLEEIYRMHLSIENLVEPLKEWCKENLPGIRSTKAAKG